YHFLEKYARLNQKNIPHISPEAMQILISQEYPGNVRELENTIERGVIFCRSDTLKVNDLHLDDDQNQIPAEFNEDITQLPFKEAKDKMTDIFHGLYIRSLLSKSAGNISKAAEAAGIQRQYLHRLMKESNIRAEDFRSGN
ncbi:MAG: sigma-54-dependent Fis family transcriptional regulator, partial [Desulfobacterales bacterium]